MSEYWPGAPDVKKPGWRLREFLNPLAIVMVTACLILIGDLEPFPKLIRLDPKMERRSIGAFVSI